MISIPCTLAHTHSAYCFLSRCTKFSEMIMQLPLVFIELSKAWHLSGIDEQAIEQVISEVGAISHTLLLYPAIALVNQARLSPSSLREKQVNIVNSIAQVSTENMYKYVLLTIATVSYHNIERESGLSSVLGM